MLCNPSGQVRHDLEFLKHAMQRIGLFFLEAMINERGRAESLIQEEDSVARSGRI